MNLLHRINPTTRIVGLALWTTPLLLSIDWVSAAVALGLTVVMGLACGLTPWRVVRIGWPLLLVAPLSGIGMLLYGRAGGAEHFRWGPVVITDNSIELAIGITLRVLAVGLPAVMLLANIDPTRLGDGLAQLWRLPTRFVLGSVAGVRMASLFRRDWSALDRARRARGLGDKPALVRLPQQSFTLLVLALRRAGKLATAMEARGFGGNLENRTWARVARLTGWDALFVALCLGIGIAAIAVAAATGHFSLLGVG